jgi:hypothetical protein
MFQHIKLQNNVKLLPPPENHAPKDVAPPERPPIRHMPKIWCSCGTGGTKTLNSQQARNHLAYPKISPLIHPEANRLRIQIINLYATPSPCERE